MKRRPLGAAVAIGLLAATLGSSGPVDAKAQIFNSACIHAVTIDQYSTSPAITQSGALMYASSPNCRKAQVTAQANFFGNVVQVPGNCVFVAPGSYPHVFAYGNPVGTIAGTTTGTLSCADVVNYLPW